MLSPQRRFFSCISSGKSAITALSHDGRKNGDFIALPYNEIARLTKSTGRFRIYYRFHFYYVKNRNSCFYKRGSSDMLRLGSPLRVKIEENKTATGNPAAHICGHDGIGRHARFRFSCSDALGFESPCPHQKSTMVLIQNHRAFSILVDIYTAI